MERLPGRIFTAHEAAAYLRVTVRGVNKLCRLGAIDYHSGKGGKLLISESALVGYLARVTRRAMPVEKTRPTMDPLEPYVSRLCQQIIDTMVRAGHVAIVQPDQTKERQAA